MIGHVSSLVLCKDSSRFCTFGFNGPSSTPHPALGSQASQYTVAQQQQSLPVFNGKQSIEHAITRQHDAQWGQNFTKIANIVKIWSSKFLSFFRFHGIFSYFFSFFTCYFLMRLMQSFIKSVDRLLTLFYLLYANCYQFHQFMEFFF